MSVQKKKKETSVPTLSATQTAAIDHDTLTAARTRIDATAVVLTGFHLRHKNQHRVSTYWWPALGQLRRHVRRLGSDLEMADKATIAATRMAAAKRTPKGSPRDDRSPVALVLARARWIRVHFVPKAYIAFSRLVADRQFAPLGLLLMGVLAQVNAVLRSLDAATGSASVDETDALLDRGEALRKTSANSESGEDDDCAALRPAKRPDRDTFASIEPAADFGVAVPREEDGDNKEGLDGRLTQTKGVSDSTTRPASSRPGRGGDEDDNSTGPTPSAVYLAEKRRKGEHPGEDTADLVAAKPAETARDVLPEKSEKKERKEKKAKAKAKKRKRDEFDDLFNGLL